MREIPGQIQSACLSYPEVFIFSENMLPACSQGANGGLLGAA